MDRLLKPNTTMQNSAQNKKFIADGASVNKRANTSKFYLQEKSQPKAFTGTRRFATNDFSSRSFGRGNEKVPLSSAQLTPQSKRAYETTSANIARAPHDAAKVNRTREFADNRLFLAQGKSQKSLNRENPPMTIEQVRELLNKNK